MGIEDRGYDPEAERNEAYDAWLESLGVDNVDLAQAFAKRCYADVFRGGRTPNPESTMRDAIVDFDRDIAKTNVAEFFKGQGSNFVERFVVEACADYAGQLWGEF